MPLPHSASQVDASVQKANNEGFKTVGLLKFTEEFRLCCNMGSLIQYYLEILCILHSWKMLYSRIQRKKDLLASTSISYLGVIFLNLGLNHVVFSFILWTVYNETLKLKVALKSIVILETTRQQLRDKDVISNNTVIQPAELLATLQKAITQSYGFLGLLWTVHANKIVCYNYLAGPCILLEFKQTASKLLNFALFYID